MLSNLITSLLISVCVGASSFNYDHSANTNNYIDNSIVPSGDSYLLGGYISTDNISNTFTFQRISNVDTIEFYFYTNSSSYIIGDSWYDSSSQFDRITGNHQHIFYGINFQFNRDSLNDVNPSDDFELDIFLYCFEYPNSYSWYNYNNLPSAYSDDEILCFYNVPLTNYVVNRTGSGNNYSDKEIIDTNISVINSLVYANIGENPHSHNDYFNDISFNNGYYSFPLEYNVWQVIRTSLPNTGYKFGIPYSSIDAVLNLNNLTLNEGDLWYETPSDTTTYTRRSIDIFEGRFLSGGIEYTTIRLYFAIVSGPWLGSSTDYAYRCSASFIYGEYINTNNGNSMIFLTTKGYVSDGTFNGFIFYSDYDSSKSLKDNFNSTNSGIVAFTDYKFLSNYITIKYSLSRPTNSSGFKSGTSFFQLLNYNPYNDSNTPGGSDLLSVFNLINLSINGLFPLLDARVLPGITLGALLFLPLVFVIIMAVIKLFKR